MAASSNAAAGSSPTTWTGSFATRRLRRCASAPPPAAGWRRSSDCRRRGPAGRRASEQMDHAVLRPAMKPRLCAFALALILVTPGSASAQVYPSRPVTMVVPYPAGGPSDALGRILAEAMRGVLGQPVVIEN